MKKLSGGDYVTARPLYSNAIKFTNTAALLFAGNHLPVIKGGIDRSNAFSQRIEVFPFQNQVPKGLQDIKLLDKLLEEKSYIAKWALKGLARWRLNNYQFTTCEEIEEIHETYTSNNNSIRSFLKNKCLMDPTLRTHNSALLSAYREFCSENEFIIESEHTFHRHLREIHGLTRGRFRENGDNEFGYYGIGLIEA